MVQVLEKCEEFIGGEVRRHGDIRHGPFLPFGADQEELPAAIDSLRLHHSAEHVEQVRFRLHIAHIHTLEHTRRDVNFVITASPTECERVRAEEGGKRGP